MTISTMRVLLANSFRNIYSVCMCFSPSPGIYMMYSKSFLNSSEDSANSQQQRSLHEMEQPAQPQELF